MEYNEIIDQAAEHPDSLMRLCLVAIHGCTQMAPIERITTKPFNPILGETYEYVTERFKYIAEQVSHHPPVTAVYCEGKHYKYSTCQATNTSFNGSMLKITH